MPLISSLHENKQHNMIKATKVTIQNNDKNKTKSKKLPPKKRGQKRALSWSSNNAAIGTNSKIRNRNERKQKGDKNERIRALTSTK